MKRMKLYDVPHKGLRNALSQLSLLAGNTDYTNQYETENLYKLGISVFTILNIHASDEDEITLTSLEERCPCCSEHDTEDHKKIHHAQQQLERMLASLCNDTLTNEQKTEAGAEFYLSLSEFHAMYLLHTAEEERITQPLLWEHFSDDELAAHRARIMSKNPPETLLTWFRFVIPAQSHTERIGLLSGFKKMASPDFYRKGMEVIEEVLPERVFKKLVSDL